MEAIEVAKRLGINKDSLFGIYINIALIDSNVLNWNTHLIYSKLLGEGLGLCTIEELQQIEQQLERSVTKVRARKVPFIFSFLHN